MIVGGDLANRRKSLTASLTTLSNCRFSICLPAPLLAYPRTRSNQLHRIGLLPDLSGRARFAVFGLALGNRPNSVCEISDRSKRLFEFMRHHVGKHADQTGLFKSLKSGLSLQHFVLRGFPLHPLSASGHPPESTSPNCATRAATRTCRICVYRPRFSSRATKLTFLLARASSSLPSPRAT